MTHFILVLRRLPAWALLATIVCLTTCGTARADTNDTRVGTSLADLPALPVLVSQPAPADTIGPDSTARTAAVAVNDRATPADSAALRRATDSIARKVGAPQLPRKQFVSSPTRALWLALAFPGAGQIYNRKLWKLPIFYGGFVGCAYALMWNQQMYRDYSQAYLDIMDNDPNTHSYLDMLPPRYDITGKEDQFKAVFKRKKDYYRRYRDLSAFCFVGVYLLSVIDAYVDAQLSVFDISPDLSMSVSPAVLQGESGTLAPHTPTAYGIGCSLRF